MKLISLIVLLALTVLTGCKPKPAEEAKQPQAVLPAARTPLYGGDPQAWLGYLGDPADTNYCRAQLKLPLAAQPAWQYEYSGAEFSGRPPSVILHFAGRLALSAQSPQLMVMDALSGKPLVNRDVFVRVERTFSSDPDEQFEALCISPTGRLVANDNLNRLYCFDLELNRLWTLYSEENETQEAPLTADEQRVFTSWGIPDVLNYHAVGLESGKHDWTYLLASRSVRPAEKGISLSPKHATVLCYIAPNQLRAANSETGDARWGLGARSAVALAPIDEGRGVVHIVLRDESLECRALADGELRWRYSWEHLLSEQERARRLEESLLASMGQTFLSNNWVSYCLAPDGSYLALQSGHVVKLDPQGRELWAVQLDTSITGMVGFANAVLIAQTYVRPDRDLKDKVESLEPWQIDPFNLVRPKWKLPRLGEQDERDRPLRHQRWTKLSALSPADGAILSAVEPEINAVSNLCPAGGKVVFGGARAGSGFRGENTDHVVAYDWVAP